MTADAGDSPATRILFGDGEAILVARIWATVDLERSIEAFGGVGAPLADDPLLGARVSLVRPAAGVPVCLLEPREEGRLAAGLARYGEGPAGRYVTAAPGLEHIAARATTSAIPFRRAATGPFGPCILLLEGSRSGPHLVVVEAPTGTIEP